MDTNLSDAISSCRGELVYGDTDVLHKNWRQTFKEHNTHVLGTIGDAQVFDDALLWITTNKAPIGTPMVIYAPPIVRLRDDGSRVIMCVGILK